MSVRLDSECIHLEGLCRVEDAEPLARLLQESPSRTVDLSRCEQLHAAVLQALLAFRPAVAKEPQNDFLRGLAARIATTPAGVDK